jgi:hypothetical protein
VFLLFFGLKLFQRETFVFCHLKLRTLTLAKVSRNFGFAKPKKKGVTQGFDKSEKSE